MNPGFSTRPFSTRQLSTRQWLGISLLLVAAILWIPSGDVIDMIIRQKEIVFGRYSRGHFSVLLVLTLVLLGLAALCFSRLKTLGEMFGVSLLVLVSTGLSMFVLIVGSGWAVKPRYVEKVVTQGEGEQQVKGLVRHRSPNEFYRLPQIDKPEQARSYPDAPAGYPTFELTLTTDSHGFRNEMKDGVLLSHYDIVATGDSFVAGSHVSDEQAWVALLQKQMNTTIYNLGVSGSDPGNYYNNFILLGKQFKPRLVLFMLYEGNDFKKLTPLVTVEKRAGNKNNNKNKTKNGSSHGGASLSQQIALLTEASPVTKGLRRFFAEVLEPARSDRPVPGYREKVGFMPIQVNTGSRPHYYGFEPKRLTYLYEEKEAFRQSDIWKGVSDIMQRLVTSGEKEGFQVLFLYVPSTPHVVMPLVKDQIPAEQLRNFAAYDEDNLPDAEMFKKNVFDWMDNEQNVFLEQCADQHWHCLSLTAALQQATANGKQVYYSYDQHWTPDGNRVVADTVTGFLLKEKLISPH